MGSISSDEEDGIYAGTNGYSAIAFNFDKFDDWLEELESFLLSSFKHFYIPKPAINFKIIVPKTTLTQTGKMGAKRMEFLRFVHPDIKNSVEIG